MLRPGGVACPAPARTFTTELSWAGSPQKPRSVMTGWFIVFYHRRTFTGWTGSLMGCELICANKRWDKAPSFKLQSPGKPQATKPQARCRRLKLSAWSFPEAWSLEFEALSFIAASLLSSFTSED